jgi:hypothetical protein
MILFIVVFCLFTFRSYSILPTASVALMVNVLALSVVDRGFELLCGQTKNYEIGICCFSAKHSELREKSKY